MSDFKFRIVKKSKEGVLLSPKKGSEPFKIGWDELKKGYIIKEDIWAIPNAETTKKLDEINEHVASAASSFIMAGGLKGDIVNPVQTLVLGTEIEKIVELAGCSNLEAIQLIKNVIDEMQNPKVDRPKKHHPKTNKKPAPTQVQHTGTAILADNPALLELKKKLKK